MNSLTGFSNRPLTILPGEAHGVAVGEGVTVGVSVGIGIGVFVMVAGMISSTLFQTETQRAVSAGQTITLGDYILEYEGLERFVATDGRMVSRAQTVVYRNGKEVARLVPRIDNYPSGQPMSIPGKHTTLLGDDFYLAICFGVR